MLGKIFKVLLFLAVMERIINAWPTMYKVDENNILKKDLIPVSSTVIPLPIYKVSSAGYNVKLSKEEEINVKPKGQISLITVNNKKASLKEEKKTNVKQTSKKDSGL